jgi:hypothetical protein
MLFFDNRRHKNGFSRGFFTGGLFLDRLGSPSVAPYRAAAFGARGVGRLERLRRKAKALAFMRLRERISLAFFHAATMAQAHFKRKKFLLCSNRKIDLAMAGFDILTSAETDIVGGIPACRVIVFAGRYRGNSAAQGQAAAL